MPPSLIALAIFILLIILCVKGIMWGASLLVLLYGAISSLVLSMVMIFALPPETVWDGPNIPYLPIVSSAFIFIFAIISVSSGQKHTNKPIGHHNKEGMAAFGLGIFLFFVAIICFCLFIFGEIPDSPNPIAAVLTFSTSIIACTIFLDYSAKFESVKFPNIYRWLSLWVSALLFFVVFVACLIFLFAFPGDQLVAHPFWASITALNNIPIAFLFIGLNEGYVKQEMANQAIKQTENTDDFTLG